jgi:DNA polymerase-3 subunit beta
MKLTISQATLSRALTTVAKAAPSKSTLPVLSNILIDANGRLMFSATNLEMGITIWTDAKISEPGTTTVPARTMAELVGTLTGDLEMTFNPKKQALTIGPATVKCIDADEFPPVFNPETTEPAAIVPGPLLAEMIEQVAFAASTDQSRPILQGIHVTLQGSAIKLATADGFRMAVRKAEIETSVKKAQSFTVPVKCMIELARMVNPAEPVKIILPPGRGQAIFSQDNLQVVSQLIDGTYPDVDQLIPKSGKTTATIPTTALHRAAKQVDIFAREGSGLMKMALDPAGKLQCTGESQETGHAIPEIDAQVEGEALTIGVNVEFLIQFLNVVKAPQVKIQMNTSTGPMLFTAPGMDGYSVTVMPMHIG